MHDAFVAKFTAKANAIKVGNGFDAGVTQGPVIDDDAMKKIESHVADALAKGATLVTGGHRMAGLGSDRFYEPTIVTGATSEMLFAREETFGPVAPVISVAEGPFGGVKQSGLGREGSRNGIEDYVEIKYLCLGEIQR